ncbi:AAA family ATPase [Myroides odoratimimus]|uniref:AAA family ATPase n=1 Tax=Myroides odoratimimus TaxID=76832 RepID=UPI002574DC36|nr:AAA family ATPase [Myroides odoratimimus]MDM1033788.1 AAA family ATPase [Myroides odoratimimus]
MDRLQKEKIVEQLKLMSAKSSQNKLAVKAGISAGTLSQMINGKWDYIKDEMWNKVRINLGITFGWQTAETTNYKQLKELLNSIQTRSISVCVSHDAGAGKTHTYKEYAKENQNVIYVECNNYWTKKIFVRELVRACGLEIEGSIETLIIRFLDYIKGLHKPLVIIDQIDKLKDPSLDLFMDFYNVSDGNCAFLLSGVPALKKRIERGCVLDKIGYKELRSRIGRSYLKLSPITVEDVTAICYANGITDEDLAFEIFNNCQGDLRRVKRDIDKHFMINEESQACL